MKFGAKFQTSFLFSKPMRFKHGCRG